MKGEGQRGKRLGGGVGYGGSSVGLRPHASFL